MEPAVLVLVEVIEVVRWMLDDDDDDDDDEDGNTEVEVAPAPK